MIALFFPLHNLDSLAELPLLPCGDIDDGTDFQCAMAQNCEYAEDCPHGDEAEL